MRPMRRANNGQHGPAIALLQRQIERVKHEYGGNNDHPVLELQTINRKPFG
jgi:hypothetical protein